MIIYLGSVVGCLLANFLVFFKIAKDVENEGYKFKKKKRNIFDEIIGYIKIFLFSAIPLGNLLFSGVLLFKANKLSQKIIEEGLVDGTIIKKEANENLKIKEEFEVNTDNYVESKVEVYKVNETQRKQMTREEKIAFLKEEYNRLTGEELQSKLDEFEQMAHKLLEKR